MKTPTVAAGLVRSFRDFASHKGADQDELLRRTGLAGTDLSDQDARVPLRRYQALIDTAIAMTGDGALPLRFATETRLEDISIVGLIVHSSASMADSLLQLNRYSKLMVEVDVMEHGERYSVTPERGEIWIVDNRPDPNSFPALTETAFGRFIGEFRRHFSDKPFALEMQVTHSPPAHANAYAEIFRIPVHFGCNRNALRIDPEWLETEFDESAYVFGVFAERADRLLEALQQDETMRGRIESFLLPNLHKGEQSVEAAAAAMGMSRQTLYRRLKDEGTTFAQIQDELRHRMAADYLSARKVSVNQTAYLVGFSEPSSFARAFRRWTGRTPAEYRTA